MPERDGVRIVLRPDYRIEYLCGPAQSREPAIELNPGVFVLLAGALECTAGEEHRLLTAPAVTLVNSGVALGWRVDRGRQAVEYLLVSIKPAAIDRVTGQLGVGDRGAVVFPSPFAETSVEISLLARLFTRELGASGPGRDEALDLLAAVFALDVIRGYARVDRFTRLERSRAGFVDRRLRRSIEFMHDNYSRDLALGEIAAAAYLSEFHFARLFKQVTGQTPHAYLASIRLEHAKRLLAETDLSISEVGAHVGYSSASHFGKVFRQATGITPTAFREALLE